MAVQVLADASHDGSPFARCRNRNQMQTPKGFAWSWLAVWRTLMMITATGGITTAIMAVTTIMTDAGMTATMVVATGVVTIVIATMTE